MFEIVALALILLAYSAGYIVSLYSLGVYIDPDKVRTLLPNATPGRRGFLQALTDNPRASQQVATVFKSFQLVLVCVLAGILLQTIARRAGISPYLVFPIGFAIIWSLHILVVEFLPRRRTRLAVDQRLLRHLWLIRLVHRIFLPIFGGYERILRRTQEEEPVSEEEKEDIIERAIETLADQAGIEERLVEKDEKEMIGQIFLLDQTLVREIMVPRVRITGIERRMNFQEIRRLAMEDGHSRFPVYDQSIDRVVGMLYVKDLFNNMPAPGEEFVIGRYLRRPYFVPESKIIGELLREFKSRKQHIALVVDEYGGLAGLVTLEDILEEIVGDIQDEHDAGEVQMVTTENDGFLVDAALQVADLQDIFRVDYAHEEADTVGALMYHLFGSVPKPGDKVRWHDLRFEIRSVTGQRIQIVFVKRRSPSANWTNNNNLSQRD